MNNPGKIEVHQESQLFNKLSSLAFRFVYPITIVVGVLVLLSGLIFFIRPKYRSIVDDIQKANTEKAELKDLMERYLARLDTYNANYKALSAAERDKVDYILPDGANQEFLFALFEDFAKNQGVVLIGVKVGDEKAAKAEKGAKTAVVRPGMGLTHVTANFAGLDYRAMLNMLDMLENNLRFFDIEKVRFDPDQFTLELDMVTYYYK